MLHLTWLFQELQPFATMQGMLGRNRKPREVAL